LSTNQKYASQIQDFITKYYAYQTKSPIDIIVEPTQTEKEKLGPVGALNFIVSQLHPSSLLILGGDNLFGFELDDFLDFSMSRDSVCNAVCRFGTHDDVSQYGVVLLRADKTFKDFHEKKTVISYRDVSTACYFLPKSSVISISEYLQYGGDPDSLGSFVHWLMKGRSVTGFVFANSWFDVGTREKFLQANWHYLIDYRRGRTEGDVQVEGPVQIERTAAVKDSSIGPNVYVGHNVQIIDSVVKSSVIMDGSVIRHSTVIDSVVGPNSVVEGGVIEAVFGPKAWFMASLRREIGE
jgi:glucose-1-phosphate thymidylyltransferase